MFRPLKLLLPALFPSWRFFDVIAPSPRIEFTLLSSDAESESESTSQWHEFRPRPAHLSFVRMLWRMFWNPRWNESLFLVSCAERLLENPTRHSEDEILNRIMTDLTADILYAQLTHSTNLQFRLLLVQREGAAITQEVAFYSRVEPLTTRSGA